ncbi:unnamed protein product [Prunus armeniaca]
MDVLAFHGSVLTLLASWNSAAKLASSLAMVPIKKGIVALIPSPAGKASLSPSPFSPPQRTYTPTYLPFPPLTHTLPSHSPIPSPASSSHSSSPHIPSTSSTQDSPLPPPPPPPPPPSLIPTHPMQTCSKSGITKPRHPFPFTLFASSLTPSIPTTYKQATKDPHWLQAMHDELTALQRTHTWTLVPPHSAQNLVGSKWVFGIKQHADGSIERIRLALLPKASINLKAPHASTNNYTMLCFPWVFKHPLHTPFSSSRSIVIHVYVEDIVLTSNNPSYCTQLISQLGSQFAIKDLGALHYFLGIEVHRTASGLFLSQTKYTIDLLSKTDMLDTKPFPSPATTAKLASNSGELLSNPTSYKYIVSALQYLTWTCPDISYSINQVCQFLHAPSTTHLTAVK